MFLYNDGTRRHVIQKTHSNFHCTLCGNELKPRHERFLWLPGRRNISNCLDYRCQSYECEFCQELYLLIFFEVGEKRYRFIDESSEVLPEPFNQYIVNERLLLSDSEGKIIFNHAGTSMEDKFAFGRGMFNMSTEQIVFGDMDKEWE